jgi:DUF2075 family protein
VLAYLATKQQFLNDAPEIDEIVASAVKKNLGISVGPSETASWRNSLGNAMFHVMADVSIPADASVAVEYRLNGRKFRIDFLVAGQDASGRESMVIIELKQWEEVFLSELEGHVYTFLGGAHRDVVHPSYQAWSYGFHLLNYNEYVYSNLLEVTPCAYLHNCKSGEIVTHEKYSELLEVAPVFIKGEIAPLRELIKSRIATGGDKEILKRVDLSPIRPSKQLADAVGSMLDGLEEFVLLDDQKTVLEKIVSTATKAQVEKKQVIIVNGGPGTGKSVISINALSRLSALRMTARYITPNQAPRTVFEKKLKNVLSGGVIHNLFSGSGSYVGVEPDSFDALIVDEAHRLKLRTQYAKGGVNQIKEIIDSARMTVFFIDEAQKVTWKDIGEIASIEQFAREADADIQYLELTSQFRCSGSDDYMVWLDNALGIKVDNESYFSPSRFDFRIVDDPAELKDLIEERNKEANKSRMVAGYCWDWVSKKKNSSAIDIQFPEYAFEAKWNLDTPNDAWIIRTDSVREVGCIHTCQGLELDYVGVIVGPDLVMDAGELITIPAARAKTDKSLHGYKKEMKENPVLASQKADEIIRNTYRTLMTRGMKGCYVYFTDNATAAYFKSLLPEQTENV